MRKACNGTWAFATLLFALFIAALSVTVETQGTGWRIRVGSEERFVGSAAAPNITNATTLGTSARRWSTVFGVNSNFSGTTTMTGAQTITIDSVATETLTALGLSLVNDTAAANGAQQYSPILRLRSRGWETGGGTSQTLDGLIQMQPVQGANVAGTLKFGISRNGAAVTDIFGATITSGGTRILNLSAVTALYGWGSTCLLGSPTDLELNVVSNSGLAFCGVRAGYVVEANTGAKTPTALESSELYTNTGDADGSSITLLNDPAVGMTTRVAVTAAQTITIAASAGESLRFGASTCGTSLTSATVGSTATIVAVTGGSGAIWATTEAMGTWTCNP